MILHTALLIWFLLTNFVLFMQSVALLHLMKTRRRHQGWWQRLLYQVRWSIMPILASHMQRIPQHARGSWWDLHEASTHAALATDIANLIKKGESA